MKPILLLSVFALTAGTTEIDPETDARLQLATVKRIYVDKLTGGDGADQIRDMLMASLQSAGLWTITENSEKADAFLRGAAEDLIYTESRESHDGITARVSLSTRQGAYSSSDRNDRATSAGVGQNEGSRATERKHEASAAVRLVNKDGDLIWSATKESAGAKFRGSASDVAEKVVKQLIVDFQASRKLSLPRQP